MRLPQPQPAIDIRPVGDLAGMEALKPAWNELLMAAIRPTVFDAWEWQYQCARLLADGRDLVILAAYQGDRLVGLLPLHRVKISMGSLIPASALAPLGGAITDYNACLIRERHLSRVVPAMAGYLKSRGALLDLHNVRPGTCLYILRAHLIRQGFLQAMYEAKSALATNLGRDYESFIQNRQSKFRRKLRQNQNNMDRVGGYTYHTEAATEELLATLVRLHTWRWEQKGESGALAAKRTQAFHAGLHKMTERPFEIRYFTIRHDGQIVAILYGFIFRGCYYAYLSGFDMAHNRISPGNMIINHAIQELIGEGIVGFDLLRGDMHYKQSWATVDLTMQDMVLFPPTIGGRVRYLSTAILQAIKRMIPKRIKKGLKSAVSSSIFP